MPQVLDRARAVGRLMAPGVHRPVYGLFFVTTRCNASCEHCFYWRELNTRVKEELTPDEFGRVAKSIGPMLQITFTGGSPELRPDLPELVEQVVSHCRPAQITFCMLGHATGRIVSHVRAILERCPETPVKIGISIDGLGEAHDTLRGIPGLFDRVVETIKALAEVRREHPRLRVDIGMTVHGLNYETVPETARWIRANLPVDVLKPILVRGEPMNPAAHDEHCKTTYLQIVDADRASLGGGRHARRFSALDYLVGAKELVQREIISETAERGETALTCAGGRETMVLYPRGDVAGCELRPDVLGNVRDVDYDIGRIWFGARADAFRDTAGREAPCSGCYHHCFVAPALFRTPAIWPRLLLAAAEVRRMERDRRRSS